MKLAVSNPNFSIVVPGECNAKCAFCFWRNEKPMEKQSYLRLLSHVLKCLPAEFEQCSITGGEPTLSPYLFEILHLVRQRFKKVVLSTNGARVDPYTISMVDHINISRHHYNEEENRKIFNGTGILGASGVKGIVHFAESEGVDVTLNCVLDPNFGDAEFVRRYIAFAKAVNVHAVAFRKQHSDLNIMPVENVLHSKVISDTSCPACRTRIRYLDGLKTSWKYSVSEPTEVMDGVYELVFHPNASLTTDWAGKNKFVLKDPRPLLGKGFSRRVPVPEISGGGDCNSLVTARGCGWVKVDTCHGPQWEQKSTCEAPFSGCGTLKTRSTGCGSSGCG